MPYAIGVPFVEEARTFDVEHPCQSGCSVDDGLLLSRIQSHELTPIHLRLAFFPGGHTAAPKNHATWAKNDASFSVFGPHRQGGRSSTRRERSGWTAEVSVWVSPLQGLEAEACFFTDWPLVTCPERSSESQTGQQMLELVT